MCRKNGSCRRNGADCSDCTPGCGGDLYARKVDLALPDGRTHYRTWGGMCCSFLVIVALLAALWFELNNTVHDNNFTILTAHKSNWFSSTAKTPEDGNDTL